MLAAIGGLVEPVSASASAAGPTGGEVPGIEADALVLDAGGPGWTTRVDPEAAEMVVVSWAEDPEVELELRSRTPSSELSAWVDVHGNDDEGPDRGAGEGSVDDGRTVVGPIWIGADATAADLRVVSGAPDDLRVDLLDTDVARPRSASRAAAVASPAAAGQPPGGPAWIRPRRAWATAGFATQNPGCENGPSVAAELDLAIVHHTVSSNSYGPADVPGLLRGIYYTHTVVNGWCDIGYNFVIDRFGTVWETRDGGANLPVIGGHAQGFNTGNVGIAFLGQYHPGASPPVSSPSAAALRSLTRLISWKFDLHGIDPRTRVLFRSRGSTRYPEGTVLDLPRIIGHRDVGLTACPGDNLFGQLPNVWIGTLGATGSPPEFSFGFAGDVAVTGDWNLDGVDTPGVFRPTGPFGTFYLTNATTGGPAAATFGFGYSSDIALVGDWNGDGIDTIGVFRPGQTYGQFLLRNANTNGPVDFDFGFGFGTDVPVVGDWNGDGIDTVGVRRGNVVFLRDTNSGGPVNAAYAIGDAADVPAAGDFDGDGIDTFALRRGTSILVGNHHWAPVAQGSWTAGAAGQRLVTGTTDTGRPDSLGLARPDGAYLAWDLVAEQPRG